MFVVSRTAGLKSLTDRAGNVLTMTPGRDHVDAPARSGVDPRPRLHARRAGTDHADHGPDGRSLVYAYDPAGDLVSVTDREGAVTAFTYEEELPHHLRDIQDPLGRRPIRNEYFEDGRLKSHTDAFGNAISYQHDLLGRQEIVTDRTGAQRVLEYDERGNVVRETDPQGRVVVRTLRRPQQPADGDGALRPGEPAGSRSRPRPTPTTLPTTCSRPRTPSGTRPPTPTTPPARC